MRRAVLCWIWTLVAMLAIAPGGRASAQPVSLPPGVQSAGQISGDQQSQLTRYIEVQLETLRTGSYRARSQARDQLLAMFDHPSVSTAFRLACTRDLDAALTSMIETGDEFLRRSAYRIAARTATDSMARLFETPIAAGSQADRIMALGQVRVLFLEADRGGLAVQPPTLDRLGGALGRLLAEESDPHVALFEVRALRTLSSLQRPELASVTRSAIIQIGRGSGARLAGIKKRAFGESDQDRTELLVHLEAADAARAWLALGSGRALNPEAAGEIARLSGQLLAFVFRTYELVPPRAEDTRRYLERLTQRAMETIQETVRRSVESGGTAPVLPRPDGLVRSLSNGDLRQFKLDVLPLIGENGVLERLFKLKPGIFQLD